MWLVRTAPVYASRRRRGHGSILKMGGQKGVSVVFQRVDRSQQATFAIAFVVEINRAKFQLGRNQEIRKTITTAIVKQDTTDPSLAFALVGFLFWDGGWRTQSDWAHLSRFLRAAQRVS
ncbi:hypothetical protein VTI28DRAFT_9083 [Corynascus sepedonium]